MKPQKKSKELFDRYKNLTTYQYQEYAGASYSTFEHDIDIIKQCALVCCDEIINVHYKLDGDNSGIGESYKYWVEVKQEIQKL